MTSAVVGDLDADGDREVVAASWSQVFVWNHDGSPYPAWPKAVGTFSAPALADLDGNGDLEIVLASTDRRLFVWNHDGSVFPGWPYVWTGGTGSGFIGPPAVADLDADGDLEIAAGTGQGPFTNLPHDFFIWDRNGSVRPGFPFTSLYQREAPAAAEIGSGEGLELAFSGGGFAGEDELYLIDSTGALKAGWPVQLQEIKQSAPAAADLDGDGIRDLVIGGGQLVAATCVRPRVYGLNHLGLPLPGFPIDLPVSSGGVCPIISPIVVADLDGDHNLEILVKYRDSVGAFHGDGSCVAGFPYTLSDDGVSSDRAPGPAVDDLDGDGLLEMVFVSSSGRVAFFEATSPTIPRDRVWPMYKHDSRGTSSSGRTDLFGDGFESGDTSAWSETVQEGPEPPDDQF